MSLWQRIRDFFVGPARHDELEADDWEDAPVQWPPLAALPDQPVGGGDEGASAWADDEDASDRVPADDDVSEIGQPVLDDGGEPVIVLGLFGGRVRQGPLMVRHTSGKNAGTQFFVYDVESGAHWPASTDELEAETTTRISG